MLSRELNLLAAHMRLLGREGPVVTISSAQALAFAEQLQQCADLALALEGRPVPAELRWQPSDKVVRLSDHLTRRERERAKGDGS